MDGPLPGGPAAGQLAGALLDATEPHVSAVLLFGSRLAGTSPGAHSAYDFVVLVDAYRPFYRALAAAGHHRRPPGLLTALARLLPPNVTAFMPDVPGDPVAKCMFLTGQDFERALSPGAKDHFVKGRMVQSVAVVWARDPRTEAWVERLLADARRDVLRWVRPHVEGSFTPEELALRMLEVSYRGELRPEARSRVREVFDAQRERLGPMYAAVLDEAAHRGAVQPAGDGRYRFPRPASASERLANRLYFLKSKVRATARWFKHILTFDDWLTYIQRKVERRTGRPVELTERERRYPLIFLWPKVFRVLRTLPEDGGGGGDAEEAAERPVRELPDEEPVEEEEAEGLRPGERARP